MELRKGEMQYVTRRGPKAGLAFGAGHGNVAIMAKQPKPAQPESADVAALAGVLRELTYQVRQLALIMDEIREDLLGAVRNDRLDPRVSQRTVSQLLDDDDDEAVGNEGLQKTNDDECRVPSPPVHKATLPLDQEQPTLFP